MKPTRMIAIGVGTLLFFGVVFAVYVNRSAEHRLKPWSGYGYSSENNGRDPRLVDTFTDIDQCKQAGAAFLSAHVSLGIAADCKKKCIGDLFLCGKSCLLPRAPVETTTINDYQCIEKITLPVNNP